MDFFHINHPAIGVPPWLWNPSYMLFIFFHCWFCSSRLYTWSNWPGGLSYLMSTCMSYWLNPGFLIGQVLTMWVCLYLSCSVSFNPCIHIGLIHWKKHQMFGSIHFTPLFPCLLLPVVCSTSSNSLGCLFEASKRRGRWQWTGWLLDVNWWWDRNSITHLPHW